MVGPPRLCFELICIETKCIETKMSVLCVMLFADAQLQNGITYKLFSSYLALDFDIWKRFFLGQAKLPGRCHA